MERQFDQGPRVTVEAAARMVKVRFWWEAREFEVYLTPGDVRWLRRELTRELRELDEAAGG